MTEATTRPTLSHTAQTAAPSHQPITPCLWFDNQAEDAANYYVSIFKDSRINNVSRYGEGAPVPAGTALMVDFELQGVAFQALNGGPAFSFTEAVSFSVEAPTQTKTWPCS